MIILGIETSCDETAAAVLRISEGKTEIMSNVVSSQIKLHAEWGGVVPNLAAREHLKNILPVISESLESAGISHKKIDLIAVTNGPGLIPALLVGTTTAKALSFIWKKPLAGIHHIEGHIYANFIDADSDIRFPVLALVVSGGHTQLVLMKDHLEYEIIGETLDDAAGEAFDKVARILNLGYPGGPIVSEYAEKFESEQGGKGTLKIRFPRPMFDSGDFNFSFSGLKTAVLYAVKSNPEILSDEKLIRETCFEFQEAVIDTLSHKTLNALEKFDAKTVLIAGGVSANKELRSRLGEAIAKNFPGTDYHVPGIGYSVDNAAMIAAAAGYRWNRTEDKSAFSENWKTLQANANLKIN